MLIDSDSQQNKGARPTSVTWSPAAAAAAALAVVRKRLEFSFVRGNICVGAEIGVCLQDHPLKQVPRSRPYNAPSLYPAFVLSFVRLSVRLSVRPSVHPSVGRWVGSEDS